MDLGRSTGWYRGLRLFLRAAEASDTGQSSGVELKALVGVELQLCDFLRSGLGVAHVACAHAFRQHGQDAGAHLGWSGGSSGYVVDNHC